MKAATYSGLYDSPLGRLKVSGEGAWIRSLVLLPGRGSGGRLPGRVRRSLDLYFGGRPAKGMRFRPDGTAFQRKVWRALSRIPWGESISYGQLARRIGRPSAVRAVASAVAKNPVAVLIPCHRVVGAGGRLGGYAYGRAKKRWLLRHERREHG